MTHPRRLHPATIATVVGWLVVVVVYVALLRQAVGSLPAAGVGEPWGDFSFVDYRDTILTPMADLQDGNNPYDIVGYEARHPGHQPFNAYLPHHFVIFGWLAFLPTSVGLALFLAATFSAIGFLVREGIVHWRHASIWLPWLIAFMSLRGPAALGIRSGQIAVILAALAWLAIRRSPSRAQWAALAVTLIKPQVGLAVLTVMLIRGRWRAAVLGTCTAVAVALVPFVLISYTTEGPQNLLRSIIHNAIGSTSDDAFLEDPVDVVGFITAYGVSLPLLARLGLMVALIVAFTWALRRQPAPNLGMWLGPLAVVCIMPNMRYALAILIPPLLMSIWVSIRTRGANKFLVGMTGFGVYAMFRSRTVETALGLPEQFTRHGSGIAIMGMLVIAGLWSAIKTQRESCEYR